MVSRASLHAEACPGWRSAQAIFKQSPSTYQASIGPLTSPYRIGVIYVQQGYRDLYQFAQAPSFRSAQSRKDKARDSAPPMQRWQRPEHLPLHEQSARRLAILRTVQPSRSFYDVVQTPAEYRVK